MYTINQSMSTWNEANAGEHLSKLVLEAGNGLQALLTEVVLLGEHPPCPLT